MNHTEAYDSKRERERERERESNMAIHPPLWQEETVFNQDSDEKEQKSLNDHHKDITTSDVPAERISNQVLA